MLSGKDDHKDVKSVEAFVRPPLLPINRVQELSKTKQDKILELMSAGRISGISYAEVNNDEITQAALGIADEKTQTAVLPQTVFAAASLSKPMFAYLVLKILAYSKDKFAEPFKSDPKFEFNLDTKLEDIFKYERFDQKDAKWTSLITARSVLSHQTGLKNWSNPDGKLEYDSNFIATKSEKNVATKPNFYGYSGEGYLYLQKVIEKLTGKNLEQLAQEELKSLGMNFSYQTTKEMTPLVTLYDEKQRPSAIPVRTGQHGQAAESNAAGSLRTTATDYAKFIAACLEEKSFSTLVAATVNMTVDKNFKNKQGIQNLESVSWGLGWGLQLNDKNERVAFQWGDAGAKSFVAINLETKKGIVYLTNSANGLVVAKDLITPVVGNIDKSLNYLFERYGYESRENPSWQARFDGYIAESKGDLKAADKFYSQVLSNTPDDKSIARRHTWIKESLAFQEQQKVKPVDLKFTGLEQFTGQYGPCKVSFNNGSLHFKTPQEELKLIQIGTNKFVPENNFDFNLEFIKKSGHFILKTTWADINWGEIIEDSTAVKLEKMFEATCNKFAPKRSEKFKSVIGEDGVKYFKTINPISLSEEKFIQEHKDDFDETSALAIKRRQHLMGILSSDKGVEALEQKLISLPEIMKMPHPHHSRALFQEHGFIALQEKLITPNIALSFGENSSQYLEALCTEEGLSRLRDAKKEGNLESMLAMIVKHAHEFNNVGVLEHSLKERIPLDEIQADFEKQQQEPRLKS